MDPARTNAPFGDLPDQPTRDQSQSQAAAADLIRRQLAAIYEQQDVPSPPTASAPTAQPTAVAPPQTPVPPPPPAPEPSQQPHGLHTAPHPPEPTTQPSVPITTPEEWDQYHSAWQKYYQMYYERYYANHLNAKAKPFIKRLRAKKSTTTSDATSGPVVPPKAPDGLTPHAAIKELRAKIRQKIIASTTKAKKSRHFIPILAGAVALVCVLALQYNQTFFAMVAAYTTPGNIDPQNIIVDLDPNVTVGPEPRMIIPKINVDAPVVYGASPDEKSQMKAMEKGIAHFSIPKANAIPGQVGNAVFAAHSSNDAFAPGDYKFVFARNEKLQKGDVIYMNYEGKRYTYSITHTEVVLPDDGHKVQIETTKPLLTLVSCVPLGTAEKRLLVFAEQINPDPTKAAPASDNSNAPSSNAIPGKPAPTLVERLFGA